MMTMITFERTDRKHNNDTYTRNNRWNPPAEYHEESEEQEDHSKNKRLSTVVRHMNFFILAFKQGFACFLSFPVRIKSINLWYNRKVVFWNRAMCAPFQRTCIPRISSFIPRGITEAPVNVIHKHNEADRKTNSTNRSN
ncbi:hypothetical protein D3C81_1746310 [compost metagenome]